MLNNDNFGYDFGATPAFQDATATNPELYADPAVADFGPQKKPWWVRAAEESKKKLLAGGQQPQHPQAPSGSTAVDSWTSLGKGVGNLAMKLFGMADGGAVQGPTMAMIGEGGEPEYVVPQSKVAPWIAATMRDGVPPNPANLPRGESRPPPPVILANTPAMGCGGKVVPAMGCGGKVVPAMRDGGIIAPPPWMNDGVRGTSRFPAPTPEEQFAGASAPYFMASAPPALPPSPAVEAIQSPVAQQAANPVRPPMLGSPDAMKRLAELQRNRPLPKWYERPFMGNGGQLDMRPGVAAYSQTGRAVGNLISSLLPINRKSNEWERNVEAAKMDATAAQAQDAATVKQQELDRANRVADAQVAANRATEAYRNRQAEALNAPPPSVDPYKDMVEVDEATGKRAGLVPGPDGKYRIYRQNVRIPDATQETQRETPAQATQRRTQEADQLGLKGNDRVNYIAGRNVIRPPAAQGGGAGKDKLDDLLSPNEAMTLGVPYGTTRRQASGAEPKKPLAESAIKQISASKGAIGALKELKKTLEQYKDYIGPVAGLQALNPYSEANKAQAEIDRVKQNVGKTLEGGVLRKEDEEKYKKILTTLRDNPGLAVSKVDGIIADFERGIATFEEEQRRGGRRVPGATQPNKPTHKTGDRRQHPTTKEWFKFDGAQWVKE